MFYIEQFRLENHIQVIDNEEKTRLRKPVSVIMAAAMRAIIHLVDQLPESI